MAVCFCEGGAVEPKGRDVAVTGELQRAIDSISSQGGGVLELEAGEYLCGTIEMKSNVELRLMEGATILGSVNPYDYPAYYNDKASIEETNHFALVVAVGAKNVAITGKGMIDGRGLELALAIDSLHHIGERIDPGYSTRRMRPNLRPKLLEFDGVDTLAVKDVRLRASASWGLSMNKCRNVTISGIDFVNRAYWNNDGIDMVDCHNVRVTGCSIDAADDGICLKSSDPDDCNDSIFIYGNSIASSASAIKMGTGSFGGFRNVTIRNNKVRDTFRSAIAIESVDGAVIENIVVDSLEAVNTGNAFFIRLGHRHGERPGKISGVSISNLTCEVPFGRPDAEYDIRGPEINTIHNPFPASITGIPGHRVENVRLSNIKVSYPGRGTKGMAYIGKYRYKDIPEEIASYPEFHMFGELPAWGLFMRHVDGIALENVEMSTRAADYRPAMVADDDALNVVGSIKE
ncbi:MAG: glycosyl hydrolase family 28 protein [Clostridium sp.]|nr:glycosyl hydrolase family 28 protein [Clostridium sp.]